ncbi:hypothetical protein BC939DRAFT_459357 [Gamsiella multidivaricata]|uniref:uncharacterized protein n=1 Tax=Gamsiella multidivaricata TaxID=101098 RepID=UPI002220229B|nr:uncharacterized protein BC939DRAFT_459357 [Gamsiella multidivaricata]KAI7819837.1 hypothetical protein BC939DRAFT_459357 [Gamsiella multidivaricata]
MKFHVVIASAALAFVLSVSADPENLADSLAVGLTKRSTCCKYSSTGCGVGECCLWRKCIQWGGPVQCGSQICCLKYNC